MTLENLGYKKQMSTNKITFRKVEKFGTSVVDFDIEFRELEVYFVGLDNVMSIEVLSPSIIKAIYNEMEDLGWIR
jgi:hypothetical protein